MEVTMTKKQTRDLQVFMTDDTSDYECQYEPIAVDMSDVIRITNAKAYVIGKGNPDDSSTVEVTGSPSAAIQNAREIQLCCTVVLASTDETQNISFFAPPFQMGELLYPTVPVEKRWKKMADDLDDFAVMKFFLDIAHGNTRSPYTEAMMGSNK